MVHNSCNVCTRGLPDMYTLSPRALGVHIRQTTRVHVTTITYTPRSMRITIIYLICLFKMVTYQMSAIIKYLNT